jgi:hypothetical protein
VRRLFFVLMITLLLLRGWIGEAMATDMAAAGLQPAPSATKTIATHTHETRAEPPFDHQTVNSGAAHAAHGAAAMGGVGDCADQPLDTAAQPAGAHCSFHAACQACYTPTPTTAVAPLTPVFSALTRPSAAAARFASADAAPSQKPPIS